MKTLEDLFVHMLRDMYYAEKEILKALPKMARKAGSEDLREAFEHHREETEGQVETLEKVFALFDLKPRGITCEAIKGLSEEAEEIMSETEDKDARDAGLIASAQAVEHYEMARYGTMVAWAKQLGKAEAARLLQQVLDQESAADKKLSKLAQSGLNRKAA
ncbi:ferritin-like metal-binding protein YciE [Tepidamorphus gemmatus]|uniref:Ferritin-like metal-binding protein YciE n=2 Tax=Tepidamorphus gemmatus TaxID=747076 RepID=A0A4V2UZA7_9HYPH|nr:ferritin-like metal-binding protein YciE [Tepidamorphus gemmatus]